VNRCDRRLSKRIKDKEGIIVKAMKGTAIIRKNRSLSSRVSVLTVA
jgi:hypothetical protein